MIFHGQLHLFFRKTNATGSLLILLLVPKGNDDYRWVLGRGLSLFNQSFGRDCLTPYV
jgi:hypothetical protein